MNKSHKSKIDKRNFNQNQCVESFEKTTKFFLIETELIFSKSKMLIKLCGTVKTLIGAA